MLIQKIIPYLFTLLVFSMPLSMAGMEIFSWSLCAFWLIYRIINFSKIGIKDLHIPGLLFIKLYLVILFIGMMGAEHFNQQMRINVLGDSRWVLLLLVYYDLFSKNILSVNHLFKPLCTSLIIVNLFSFYQMFTGSDPFRSVEYLASFTSGDLSFWRMKGFYSTPMTYGNTMAIWFVFLFGLLVGQWEKILDSKKLVMLGTFASFCGTVFSLVRGAWVGLFLALIFLLMFYRKKLMFVVVACGIFVASMGYLFVPNLQKRIDATLSGKDPAIIDRVIIWKSYSKLFWEKPLVGVGHRYTSELTLKYQDPKDHHEGRVLQEHAHSNFLQILTGLGVLGFIGFFGYFFFLMYQVVSRSIGSSEDKKLRPFLLAAMTGALCFHLSGLTESTILDWEVVHLYALMLGLVTYGLSLKDQQSVH